MALQRADSIGDSCTTVGTGALTLLGVAPQGHLPIVGNITDGATIRVRIFNYDASNPSLTNTDWEVVEGVYTAAGQTLTRVTVYESSTGGAPINFAAGTKAVVVVLTAQDLADKQDAGSYATLGANAFTATQTVQKAVAATSTDGAALETTAAATVGAQKWSPRFRWTGSGWKTDAVAAAQAVDFIAEVQPVQGSANPSGKWVISSRVNGGAYTERMRVESGGALVLANGLFFSPISASRLGIGTTSGAVDGFIEAARFRDDTNNVAVGGVNSVTGHFCGTNAGMWWGSTNWYDTPNLGLVKNASGVAALVKSTSTSDFGDIKLRNVLAAGGNGSYVQTPSMTVANLAVASTAGAGARAFVTDASTTVILGLGLAVTGGGANKVPVYSDGTNWLIG